MKKKEEYNHRLIEPKWLEQWDKENLYKAIDFDSRPKKYILFEFPYPSGEKLHIGHAFTFTGTDVLVRFFRMKGFNVLTPMGWDAFGLPAENYAIKTGINPMITTAKNIANSKVQAKRLALSIDWGREISTTDPDYYQWTQWIFLQWYKKGLAYKAEMPINWCPKCKIGLANEEVIAGKCERCGAEATKRNIKQWVVKITEYADRLIEGLKKTAFIEKVKAAQINWIGKTSGIAIDYPVLDRHQVISCYSTRPDTNFGATFVVIAPEHPMVLSLTTKENQEKVKKYLEQAKRKSELERVDLAKEKTGVFTGSYCLNRLTGKKMPIWVSDFVVLTAGTGIVVGVPAHDERDYRFAKKYGLEIIPVVKPQKGEWNFEKGPFTEIDQAIVFNSDFLNGMPALSAKEKIIDFLVKKGWGKKAVNYHLRDWIFSRQHYWGEPIPIIFCPECGEVPVPEKDLPVRLPKVKNYKPTESGESPLATISGWVETTCPKCGGSAKRETDTMPNWAGSDWYFLRYLDPGNRQALVDLKKADYWLPVDVYVGGDEHNTLHLLYSRFTYQFLWDLGAVPKKHPEPYYKRLSHGVILGPDGQRMSKSRGNVINPDEIWQAFGVDALRTYLMFMGPFEGTMAWSQESLEGCHRFIKRVWNLVTSHLTEQETSVNLKRKLHQTIMKVGQDIESMKFNTAVAAMMEFINFWQADKNGLSSKDADLFLKILAPFSPYLAEELWARLGKKTSVHSSSWPKFDPGLVNEEVVTIIVQVNGKLREKLVVKIQESKVKTKIEELSRRSEKMKKYLGGKKIKKIVFVPGKLINFVV